MNKSKIEWCDYTWNIVTGCLRGCEYCYARRIAERFGKFKPSNFCRLCDLKSGAVLELYEKPENPYPYIFSPTFHRYRLNEPLRKTRPSRIFVSSMGDLFGDWVPKEWINAVLEIVQACPQHIFIFLTKNPKRYKEFKFPDNCWLGATITQQSELDKLWELSHLKKAFVSIEPLLDAVDFGCIFPHWIDWIIIGAQTGPGAKLPQQEWVQSIIDQARTVKVPVFLKDNLSWKIKIQEFPEGMN